MQASSNDDAVRADIIRDAMNRAGFHTSGTHHHELPEQVEEAGMQHSSACDPPWPVEHFAAQPSSLEDFALSPLETEVIFLRAALAQSTEREEYLSNMTKTLRIQLHKAYRMIALHHLNSFTCDTDMPPSPASQHNASTQH